MRPFFFGFRPRIVGALNRFPPFLLSYALHFLLYISRQKQRVVIDRGDGSGLNQVRGEKRETDGKHAFAI